MTTVSDNQPDGYAAVASELRRIADALDLLPGGPAYVRLEIQPILTEDYEQMKRHVNAVAHQLTGEWSGLKRAAGGWRHEAVAARGGVQVHVHGMVGEFPDPKDAEIEQLRRENALLRSKT